MTWDALEPGEILLPDSDPNELLLRSVGQKDYDDGEFGAGLFDLSTAEKEPGQAKLSVARESKQTPAGVRKEQNEIRPNKCVAVVGVSVEEVTTHDLLRAVDDSALVKQVTGHSYIDMRRLVHEERTARRLILTTLVEAARLRGRLDQPSA